jgi:hypothetical protein
MAGCSTGRHHLNREAVTSELRPDLLLTIQGAAVVRRFLFSSADLLRNIPSNVLRLADNRRRSRPQTSPYAATARPDQFYWDALTEILLMGFFGATLPLLNPLNYTSYSRDEVGVYDRI